MIGDWFKAPASQDNPHHWAGTLAGHALIGLGAWVLLWPLIGAELAALGALTGYACWEIAQGLMARKRMTPELVWDGLLDWTGAALGALTGLAIYAHSPMRAGACIGAILIISIIGIWRRHER